MIEELKQYLSLIDNKSYFNIGITQMIELKDVDIHFIIYNDIVDVFYCHSENTKISIDDYCEDESVIYEWLNEKK
jgi:hypothetical protein